MSATLAEQICTQMVADHFCTLAAHWPDEDEGLTPCTCDLLTKLAVTAADWIILALQHMPDDFEVRQLAGHWLRLPALDKIAGIGALAPGSKQECLQTRKRELRSRLGMNTEDTKHDSV